MPVFSTIKWDINSFKLLKEFINLKVSKQSNNILINKYSYFNGISSDIQFIYDLDGILYKDLDSLLWIQKQYKSTPKELEEKIEKITKIGSLEDLSLEEILKNYNIKNILELIFLIPKKQGLLHDYKIIEKILN